MACFGIAFLNSFSTNQCDESDVVAYAQNPTSWEAEVGGLLEFEGSLQYDKDVHYLVQKKMQSLSGHR